MSNNSIIIFITILFIFAISCSRNNSISDDIEINDLVCIDINNATLKDIMEVLEYESCICLETNDDIRIGVITNLLFLDDNIIVADKIISKSAFIFDFEGRCKKQIGRIGQGPGEYSDLTHIALTQHKNEIVIVDAMKNELIFYDTNAKFIRTEELTLRGENMEYIGDNIVYSNTSGVYEGYKNNIQNTLVISDSDNHIKYSNFPTHIDTWFNFVTHANHLRKEGSNIYYNPNLSDTIYQICSNSIKAVYAITGDKKPQITRHIKTEDYIDFAAKHTFFNGEFVFTDKICLFGIFPNLSLPVVYDKTTRDIYKLTQSRPSYTPVDFFKKGYIMTNHKNHIVVDIDPNIVIDYYHNNKDMCQNNAPIMSIVSKAEIDNNPILLLYKKK